MLCMSGGSSAECSEHHSAAAADLWRSGLPGSDGAPLTAWRASPALAPAAPRCTSCGSPAEGETAGLCIGRRPMPARSV